MPAIYEVIDFEASEWADVVGQHNGGVHVAVININEKHTHAQGAWTTISS